MDIRYFDGIRVLTHMIRIVYPLNIFVRVLRMVDPTR